jgi:mannose-6-phosphate isomerase
MDRLEDAAIAFNNWCIHAALPYWAVKGLDPMGGFYERLLMDGSPDRSATRRVRVTARQTYVYAHAGYLGWYDRARDVSDHGMTLLTERCLQNGRVNGAEVPVACAHLTDDSGQVSDASIDLYDQAFLLLACAWRIRAFNDQTSLQLAENTVAWLDQVLASPHGGWLEGAPDKLPRRQNPHMHLFEAFMALFRATGDEAFLQKADQVYALFTDHFFDADSRLVREFYTADWQPDEDKGHLCEPGHALEWVSLLHEYASLENSPELQQSLQGQMTKLFETAVTLGQNAHTGFVFDQIDREGQIRNYGHRSWTATEFIKACLVMHQRGHEKAAALAAELLEKFIKTYLSVPAHGGWRDQCGVSGIPHGKFMETSTFYHMMGLASALDTYLKNR